MAQLNVFVNEATEITVRLEEHDTFNTISILAYEANPAFQGNFNPTLQETRVVLFLRKGEQTEKAIAEMAGFAVDREFAAVDA